MPVKTKRTPLNLTFQNFFLRLSLVLVMLALISGISLDYLNFRQKETSYLPWTWLTRPSVSTQAGEKVEKKVKTASRQKPARQEKPVSKPAADISSQTDLPLVAIIIDDLGQDLSFMRALINLQVPLTVAILPEARQALETAQLASDQQFDVLIHLPLEAFNGQTIGTGADGLITTTMSREEIWTRLEKDLERLPMAKGFNNHMGSKGTTNQYLMETIMEFLKEKNLFFIDSKTSPKSIAYDLAVNMKIPAGSRQVFLDADEDRSKIKDRLFELFLSAKKNGQAIGIGHPFQETLQILETYLPEARNYGVQLTRVSEIIDRQKNTGQKKASD